MLVPNNPVLWLAVMVLVVFTIGQCQENESRRAVTEHQLMHDRGRTIQSLKRLIWLSSAIEGLHTAQTRSALFNPTKALNLGLDPALVPAAAGSPQPARVESKHKVAVESLLRDFFNPYLTPLPEREP
ncbi:parathyroid hormone 4 [Centroberyx gerrardi]|uniref:parathyroid hormone 4 n=1 Tax=Centroberyx gerrardi TaxID=166262 RepID=UPI003AAF6224